MSETEALAAGRVEAALIADAGDAFIVADADGVIRFWNPGAEGMFGYSREEALGSTLDLIVPEKQRPAHWSGYRNTMATGETKYGGKTLSVPAIRADGSRISVAFTVSLLHDDDGAVVGIGAIMRDVTAEWEERRSARRRLAELEAELKAARGDAALS